MKIDCIRTHHLRDELDEPFGFSQWYYSRRNALWVEIIADDGTTGWGECYGPAEVHQAAVHSFYAPRLIGLDPQAVDRLWHHMWQWSLDFARGGLQTFNMALQAKYGDVRLDELDEDAQDTFLATLEESPFFDMMWAMTIFGFFSMPKYGGNRDKVGWELVGFEGDHGPWTYPFGYYDAQVHGETSDGE